MTVTVFTLVSAALLLTMVVVGTLQRTTVIVVVVIITVVNILLLFAFLGQTTLASLPFLEVVVSIFQDHPPLFLFCFYTRNLNQIT